MRLDLRWIADFRDDTNLSVQYCPVFEGLGQVVADSLHTPVGHRPFPSEVSGELEMLVGLAASLADTNIAPVDGVDWVIQPHVLERTVTDSSAGRRGDPWLRFDFFLVHPLGMHERRWHDWERADLPDEMASIVGRIDEFASVDAGGHWADHYNEFAQREQVDEFLPGPVRVFLSYRAQTEDVVAMASRIHEALSGSGELSFLRVFLDRPDLRPGDWRGQLGKQIHSSEVFIPLLTPNYLEGNSLWELELVEPLREAGAAQIVPVLLTGEWADFPRLSGLQGVQILLGSDDDLFRSQIGKLKSYVVAAAGDLRRD